MKQLIRLFGIAFLVFIAFISCKQGKSSGSKLLDAVMPNIVLYNPMVESFTSGIISRKGNVSITLIEEVSSDVKIEDCIDISPEVEGAWRASLGNEKILTFRPKPEFKQGQQYTVELNLKKLFPESRNQEEFSFSFQTLPTEAVAEMTTFTVDSEETYTVKGRLTTSDSETANQVLDMVEWGGINAGVKANIEWMHDSNGTQHDFIVSKIPSKSTNGKLTLTVHDQDLGYEKQEVLSVDILPNNKDFKVHSIAYIEDYIEVRFTQQLDPKQDFKGLIRLDGIHSVLRVEDNKALLYPSASEMKYDANGQIVVSVYINESVRSLSKIKIGRDFVQKVVLANGNPKVKFPKGGILMPPASVLAASGSNNAQIVPFQTIGLRAVRVEVYRILENSIGQFLQTNKLSNTDWDIMRTARPIASKTIFLDKKGIKNLRDWNTYSLDVSELIKPEPGALYRITMSFNRSMTLLPSVPQSERLTEQIAAENDQARLNFMIEKFDQGGGYYWNPSEYESSYSYDDYKWRDRDDPTTMSYYYYNRTPAQRNLLVTDLGVIVKSSAQDQMLFLVHSIATTNPVENAHVELRNYQGQIVGEGKTDKDGQVMVVYEKGYPYYAVVSKDVQKTYIKVNPGSELSTSTFDVSGKKIKNGIEGFIWTERGVWRPGDSIYVNFLISGTALPENHPVTLEFRSPLGQLYQKRVATQAVGGIYSFVLSTDTDASTGVWNAMITVGGASFSKRLRVEAVKPNRLKIDLKFPNKVIQRGEPLNAKLHGEWLTGAVAGNLKYIIEAEFTEVRSSFDGYKGYSFDNDYRSFSPENSREIIGETDASGNALITKKFEGGEKAGGMLQAKITTRLFEPSGEASVDGITMLYSPFTSYVGILPPEGADSRLDTDKDYSFKIATVEPSGKPALKRKVEINAYKVYWYWWWRSDRSGLAKYVSDNNLKSIGKKVVQTSVDGVVSYNLNIPKNEWGTYYVTARDVNSGHESAVVLYIDWPNYGSRQKKEDGPMRLSVSLDKKIYNIGENAIVSFPATKGSRAIISVENGSEVVKTFPVECTEGQMKYSFEVTPDMQPNVYLNVTLLQPYARVSNDLPVRLYGVVPLIATSENSRLQPVLTCPDEVLPESEMTITVEEKNGRAFAYTLALVDEGLLDLTRFRTPNPWAAFNARVALGVTTWDVYNDVLGAYGGKIEQMFAIGGDDALGAPAKPSANRFPPVVKYIGTFEQKAGEKMNHKITLPAYMGRVRVMVVAVSNSDKDQKAWGATEKSVAVRAPLMVIGSAPRAISPGDEIVVPAMIIATQDGIGSISTTIKVDPNVFSIVGDDKLTTSLTQKGDKIVLFRLKVKKTIPEGHSGGFIELSVKSKKGRISKYKMDIPVRTLALPISQGESHTVAAGKTWSGEMKMYGMPGTQNLMLEVSSMPSINSAQRMEYLDSYPYGCVEQITSAVFPMLYLVDMANLSKLEQSVAKSKVELVLGKYKSYLVPDGSLALWPGSMHTNKWGSAYAFHFMTVAKNKGYRVSLEIYDRLQDILKSTAVRWNASKEGDYNLLQAYQLYVLALSDKPELGAMNRLRQSDKMTLEARWMLAAAYAVSGRKDIGRAMMAKNAITDDQAALSKTELQIQRNITYGSSERTRAVQLLGASALEMQGDAAKLAMRISKDLTSNEWMSTQTTAWCMLAMGEYVKKNGIVSSLNFDWSVDNKKGKAVSTEKNMMWSRQWENPSTGKISIENQSDGLLYIRAVASGISSGHNVVATANKLQVTVRYLSANDTLINASSIRQGLDFISEVTVRNLSVEPIFNLMMTQPVASGWEIRPDGTEKLPGVDYRDIRDDRVNSFIPRLDANSKVVIRTRLNATYAGTYLLPAIQCGAMYDGKVSGNTASSMTIVK